MASRIVVKGASGSGKTALAARLARGLDLRHVELDALHHGPGWTEPPPLEFRRRVADATAGDGWVVDGNYDSQLGSLVLDRADLVVWLDPPLRTILARLGRRTAERIREGTILWGGNRESWRTALVGRESLFVWAVRTHRNLRRELPTRAKRPDVPLVRLGSSKEVEQWLETNG